MHEFVCVMWGCNESEGYRPLPVLVRLLEKQRAGNRDRLIGTFPMQAP